MRASDGTPVNAVRGFTDKLVRIEPTPASVIYVGKGWAKAETLGPAYADMAALRGDPSDGLPGVAGIGEKTAAKLITQFGSLEGLVEAAAAGDSRVPLKTRLRLAEAADYLAVAPTVVRVAVDAPVEQSGADGVP